MRRFKLHIQTTADGYMGGPNGEIDWLTGPWSEDMTAYAQESQDPVDLIVLGRKLAEGFIPAWASMTPESSGETQESIDFMNNTPKVVISRSLTESPWENATVAGDLVKTINGLKAQPGGDIMAYGGSTLVTNLTAEGLLDELNLYVNPVAVGAGLPVFPKGGYQHLRLVTAQPFECGITGFRFETRRS